MMLKPLKDWIGPFFVWENSSVDWKCYDSEGDIPVVVGSEALVRRFLTKYMPVTSTIYYFDRTGFKSYHDGLGFRWKGTYSGIPEALKSEPKEVIEKQLVTPQK